MNNVSDRKIDAESGSTEHNNAMLKLLEKERKKEFNIIVNKTTPFYT